ncbi:unnamed protein product [Mesocestoides corti]|uniref:Microtubule-associated protein n=1 Tax=Mesocestoides corti TaxID=53468 RepID=A0A158QSU1_MESCO|nr:unnamed protein product [Mesocestoides corti]
MIPYPSQIPAEVSDQLSYFEHRSGNLQLRWNVRTKHALATVTDFPSTVPADVPMEPSSDTSNVTSHMAQLSLQTNGSAAAASRPRTGIPRYAIPYRRPGRPSANNGGGGGGDGHYSVSPSISEGASSTQQTPTTPITVSPRGRNGVRAESFGDESLPGYYGAGGGGNGAGYRYGRAASVGKLAILSCVGFAANVLELGQRLQSDQRRATSVPHDTSNSQPQRAKRTHGHTQFTSPHTFGLTSSPGDRQARVSRDPAVCGVCARGRADGCLLSPVSLVDPLRGDSESEHSSVSSHCLLFPIHLLRRLLLKSRPHASFTLWVLSREEGGDVLHAVLFRPRRRWWWRWNIQAPTFGVLIFCVREEHQAFSSSGQPRRITSKIGSLANANYKPGGGNVKILSTKADYSHAQSKCNSKANLKYKPVQLSASKGGGDVQIVDNKLTFKEEGKSRVNSFANAKHVPGGGNVKVSNIETLKLDFSEKAKSQVGSLQCSAQKSAGGDTKVNLLTASVETQATQRFDAFLLFQIFDEKLPWLKYNKPNLPPEERAKINKQSTVSPNATNEPIYTSRHSSTTS